MLLVGTCTYARSRCSIAQVGEFVGTYVRCVRRIFQQSHICAYIVAKNIETFVVLSYIYILYDYADDTTLRRVNNRIILKFIPFVLYFLLTLSLTHLSKFCQFLFTFIK